eukprot:PhM_4_TR3692/c0_g1_i1/m.47547
MDLVHLRLCAFHAGVDLIVGEDGLVLDKGTESLDLLEQLGVLALHRGLLVLRDVRHHLAVAETADAVLRGREEQHAGVALLPLVAADAAELEQALVRRHHHAALGVHGEGVGRHFTLLEGLVEVVEVEQFLVVEREHALLGVAEKSPSDVVALALVVHAHLPAAPLGVVREHQAVRRGLEEGLANVAALALAVEAVDVRDAVAQVQRLEPLVGRLQKALRKLRALAAALGHLGEARKLREVDVAESAVGAVHEQLAELAAAAEPALDAEPRQELLEVLAREDALAHATKGVADNLLLDGVHRLEAAELVAVLAELLVVLHDDGTHGLDLLLEVDVVVREGVVRGVDGVGLGVDHTRRAVGAEEPHLVGTDAGEGHEVVDDRVAVVADATDGLERLGIQHDDRTAARANEDAGAVLEHNEGCDGAARGRELEDEVAGDRVELLDKAVLAASVHEAARGNHGADAVLVGHDGEGLGALGAGAEVPPANDVVVADAEEVAAAHSEGLDVVPAAAELARHRHGARVPLKDLEVVATSEDVVLGGDDRVDGTDVLALLEEQLGCLAVVDAHVAVAETAPQLVANVRQTVNESLRLAQDPHLLALGVLHNLARHCGAQNERAVLLAGPHGGVVERGLGLAELHVEAADVGGEFADGADVRGHVVDDDLGLLGGVEVATNLRRAAELCHFILFYFLGNVTCFVFPIKYRNCN